MDSFNNQDYEKQYPSTRKSAKAEAKYWKDRTQKTYKQFAVFRHSVGKDYEETNKFLTDYLVIAWKYRHIDNEIRDNIREALQLVGHLKHLKQLL